MPCPHYIGGVCNSPRLEQPSDAVVVPTRCGGGPEAYTACSLYAESLVKGPAPPARDLGDAGGRGGVRVVAKDSPMAKIYISINVMREPISSECPRYALEQLGGGFIARCSSLRRYLTKHEARLCSQYWRDCPYR